MINISDIRKKMREKKQLVDRVFLIAWAIYFCFKFLEGTMISCNWLVPAYRTASLVLLLITLYRFTMLKEYEWKEFIIMTFIFFVGAGLLIYRHTKVYLLWAAAIIAAKDVRFEKITAVTLVTGCAVMLAAIVGSQIGLVDDLVFTARGYNRHSLGICYPTDCASHVFYLLLGLCYLRRSKLKLWMYLVLAMLVFVFYVLTRARNNTICMGILLLATAVYQTIEKKPNRVIVTKNIFGGFMTAVSVFCAFFSIYNSFFFNSKNKILTRLNGILGHRYTMGQNAFNEYGIHLWGSSVRQHGFGGETTNKLPDYFFLDISFVNILLCGGLLLFIVSMLIMTVLLYKGFKLDLYFMGMITLIFIQCSIEHHMIELHHNYFLLAALATVSQNKPMSEQNHRQF